MKRLLLLIGALAVFAPSALAATNSLKVSPSSVAAGGKVKVSGSVNGCKGPVTISSKAFSRSVSAKVKHHKFSVKATTSSTASGSYKVSGRCGGKKFATATLSVTGFY